MKRDYKEYILLDAVTPQSVTSSTDASPSVVTKNSHGLSTGDRIMIFGHATNTTVNGIFDVVVVNANTFTLKDINTGTAINGAGGGAGSGGIMMTAPKVPLISDFRNAELQIFTSGTATLTLKVAGSVGKNDGSSPNFGATQSVSNPWNYLQVVDLNDGSTVDGSTGIAAAGADLTKVYEVNINATKYLTVIPTAWTQGAITAKLMVFNNQ